ncbi:carboxypeptidase C (cathepsin A) [Lewinella marina]|uniref:Carboxypeptidase n=1 Tax=Neolewinella marina TaxID=438751 RepID=A0A2G0CAR6_9BACT|nr:carboxypeptidase [Neolewinella marina]NJB87181.1 carboxypeptidase C (cathepsin A) [Neolewinella marina]PHK97063.1 carboxypeptidase [Neolewinella marina]
MLRPFLVPLLLILLMGADLFAQLAVDTTAVPPSRTFTSRQSVTFGSKTIDLDATTGTFLLRDEDDKPIAHFGYTSYLARNADPARPRPVVFAYNGGPLSASFWLHVGILGPKRIATEDLVFNTVPPYQLVNNDYSLLEVADLVMIDPVGVGFSKPVGEAKWADFWGTDQDIRSIGLFIEQFLIHHDRMNAAKFLLGESYGTYRNAGLVRHLQEKGLMMNGVIMVSATLDVHDLFFGAGHDQSYLVFLPTYAAAGWFHELVPERPASLEEFLDEVRTFTEEEYAPALLRGDRLTDNERQRIAGQLERYTGIGSNVWLRANLRLNDGEFFQELNREARATTGRLDARFTAINQDPMTQRPERDDPFSEAIQGAYITAFRDYLYRELGADRSMTYTSSSGGREGFKWDWSHAGNMGWGTQAAVSTAADLAAAMSANPNLDVLILQGYYDAATPFYGIEHTVHHLGLDPSIRDNIAIEYFEAGHMMYVEEESRRKWKRLVDEFILEHSGSTARR